MKTGIEGRWTIQQLPDLARPTELVVLGFTGSEPDGVRRHIEELRALGVEAPSIIPAVYELSEDLLNTEPMITLPFSARTSGEVEPVLLRVQDDWFLGLGSDHTDRELEAESILASKSACPKPISLDVLKLPMSPESAQFTALWNAMEIRSWVDGELYQAGSLSQISPPAKLLPLVPGVRRGGDIAVFCGTIPLIHGTFRSGVHFSGQLSIDETELLTFAYEISGGESSDET